MFTFNPDAFTWGFWAGIAIVLGGSLVTFHLIVLMAVFILLRDMIGKKLWRRKFKK